MNQKFLNPFEVFDARLTEIQSMLVELVHKQPPPPSIIKNEDRLVTKKELAKICGVSEVTIWQREREGSIVGYRLGNLVRYKLSEVMESLTKIQRKK